MLQAFKFLRNDEAMRKYKIVAKPKGPFTREEVAVHDKPDDVWVIIDGKVYDITAFVDEHPGGPDNILQNAGGDAT
jgi:cytochrome b involved in lipid metabolism